MTERLSQERLKKALQSILELDVGGPHISAEAGFGKAMIVVERSRQIARAALNGETDK